MAYQNYAQTDPRWANQRLGTVDGITLGMAGCFVVSFANVAEHFGKDVTPADLDNIFTDRGMYIDGNLCTDDMLTKVYPEIQFTGVYNCDSIPCDLSVFNEFNNYEHEAIVELDASPAPGVQTHFCRFYDYNPQTGVVRIVDSQDGQIVSIADRYGNPAEFILKVVKYVGPSLFVPAPEVMPEIEQPAPVLPQPPLPPVPPIVDPLSRPRVTPPEEPAKPAAMETVEKPSFSWGKYNKAWVALAGLVVTLSIALRGEADPITLALIQAFTVAGVYGVKNKK